MICKGIGPHSACDFNGDLERIQPCVPHSNDNVLPEKHSDTDGLDLSDMYDLKKLN